MRFILRSTNATAAAYIKYSQAFMFIPEASFALIQVHTFIHNIYISIESEHSSHHKISMKVFIFLFLSSPSLYFIPFTVSCNSSHLSTSLSIFTIKHVPFYERIHKKSFFKVWKVAELWFCLWTLVLEMSVRYSKSPFYHDIMHTWIFN